MRGSSRITSHHLKSAKQKKIEISALLVLLLILNVLLLVLCTLLVLLSASSIEGNMTSFFKSNQFAISDLDIDTDMNAKAKHNIPTCNDRDNVLKQRAVDCADIFQMGYKKSGVYRVQPMNRLTEDRFVNVYCDMETDGGGWTVIQRRGDFQSPKDYFYKDWKSYKEGFGDLQKDFWLGNDNIFILTNQKLYSIRFDLKDVEQQKRYALYDKFWIDDENQKYTLHISDYRGDAGNSMDEHHNKSKFSTKDQDNDNHKGGSCAQMFKGAWWYGACHHSNLNGLYHKGKHESYADGVNWNTWKGYNESLEWTEIKIRPKSYKHFPEFTSTAM